MNISSDFLLTINPVLIVTNH